MIKIDQRELLLKEITSKDGFDELLEKVIDKKTFGFPKVRLGTDDPPVFLYQEGRGENNLLSVYEFYGGGGESAEARLGNRTNLSIGRQGVRERERGLILNFFCRIEFCLEVMICISQGVFSDKITYKKLSKHLNEIGGSFSTTEQKIVYLGDFGLISSTTLNLLKTSKRIRNVLGHQYLPQKNVGLKDGELDQYINLNEAIECVFNGAWYHLLVDYTQIQDQVANWLLRKPTSKS